MFPHRTFLRVSRSTALRQLTTLNSLSEPKRWDPNLFKDFQTHRIQEMVFAAAKCKEHHVHRLNASQLNAISGALDAHSFFTTAGVLTDQSKESTEPLPGRAYEKLRQYSSEYLTYALFDKNEYGFVKPDELAAGLKSLCGIEIDDADMEALLTKYDANMNGVFEPGELVPLFDDLKRHHSIANALSSKMYQSVYGNASAREARSKLLHYSAEYLTHALLDLNDDGYVTPSELRRGLNSLGVRLTREQIDAVVDKYDENRNNVFEREELIPFFNDLKVHVLISLES